MPRSDAFGSRFSREIISAEFDVGFDVIDEHLNMLITTVDMADGEGTEQRHIQTGNLGEPKEMFENTPPRLNKIGDYDYLIAPVEYGDGLEETFNAIKDATIPVVMDSIRELGSKAAIFKERKMVSDIIEESATGQPHQFDGQPLFSALHTWDFTGNKEGVSAASFTTPQTNIVTGSVGGTIYANTDQVLTDFYAARAQLRSLKDDKGTEINPVAASGWWVVAPSTVGSTERFLDLAFAEASRPSDDSDRDGFRFGVNVVYSPYLDTSVFGDATWYLFFVPPGTRPPLIMQNRQDVEHTVIEDEDARMWKWFYTMRFGLGWHAWWRCVRIDNS